MCLRYTDALTRSLVSPPASPNVTLPALEPNQCLEHHGVDAELIAEAAPCRPHAAAYLHIYCTARHYRVRAAVATSTGIRFNSPYFSSIVIS